MKPARARLFLGAFACALAATAPIRAGSPDSEEYRPAVAPAPPTPEEAARQSALADSLRLLEEAAARAAADSVLRLERGEPDLPHPAFAALDAPVDTAGLPALALLPTAAGPGPARLDDPFERDAVSEALRLGAVQARRHRVLSPEATARPFGRASAVPDGCFTPRCSARAARVVGAGGSAGADLLLLSEWSRLPASPSRPRLRPAVLTLALLDTRTGRVQRALRARACPDVLGPVPFAQQAIWRLLLGEEAPPPAREEPPVSATDADPAAEPAADQTAPSQGCSLVAETLVDSGDWRGIAWLNRRDSVDHRLRAAAAASGLMAAGLGLAWLQGQLLGEDDNATTPARPLRGGSGADSWLRGFFASPGLAARHAALGGAGLAGADDAEAVILNPAGVADAERESFSAAKRNLADGAPSFQLAYAGPLMGGLRHGLGARHEGDGLANETTLHGVVAGDWGAAARGLAGLRTGLGVKLYLAKVGEEGTGLDRSTGHSFGMGFDFGLKLRLSERITGGIAVRDALSFLKHSNTFTDEAHWEMLPPEYRVGAAYRADPSLLLVLDGQKAMVADQADHVRLGGEKVLFRFLALRAGLHQAFGRDPVRRMAAGFGLDSEGLDDPARPRPLRARVTVDYAYDFGLGADEPLGTGQQFSVGLSW